MTAEKPTISAILLNYNHAGFLPRALDGALNQTVPFDEVIIMDDGSTDNSVAIIEDRIRGVPHARLIRNPKNMGVMLTANAGVKEARGDFIIFLSADDEYNLRLVEWCQDFLRQYPDVTIVCGNSLIRYADSGKEHLCMFPYPQQVAVHPGSSLEIAGKKRALTFFGGASMIRRQAILHIGGYVPELRWHADWFLCLVMSHRHGFGFIPEQIAVFRIAEGQYSHARHDWRQQKQVIEALFRLLKGQYASEYDFFRNNAVLPAYDLQTLMLLLKNSEFRDYLTPLLVWRLLTYKPLRAVGNLVPEAWRVKLRRLLRV